MPLPLPLIPRLSEGPTWNIGISSELVRQVAPVRWLWTPTPDQEDTRHHLGNGKTVPHMQSFLLHLLSDLSPGQLSQVGREGDAMEEPHSLYANFVTSPGSRLCWLWLSLP